MNTPRAPTRDFVGTGVYTTTQLGVTQSLTPEGFLLCSGVPIARSGTLLYGPGEVPVDTGPDGMIHVERTAAELHAAACVASFQGKAVTLDHPDVDVTPDNWPKLSHGLLLNVRPAFAEDDPSIGLLLADVLVMSQKAIKEVRDGLREVSCGYDADYEQTAPGVAQQTHILGNHLALVPRGRCGPRCSIRDHQSTTTKEPQTMATETKTTPRSRVRLLTDAVRAAFKDAETGLMEALENTPPEDGTHVHVHLSGTPGPQTTGTADTPPADPAPAPAPADDPVEKRFVALEQQHAQILSAVQALQEAVSKLSAAPAPAPSADNAPAPADPPPADTTKDEDPELVNEQTATKDSNALANSWRDLMADAEVLVPGVRLPTFDATAKRRQTVDAMCQFRRTVLQQLEGTSAGAALLQAVGARKPQATLDCAGVAGLMRAAAGAKRLSNQATATRDAGKLPSMTTAPAAARSVADLQAQFDAYYGTGSK